MNGGDLLDRLGEVAAALADFGAQPVLVGGMALVVLGSTRVTRDVDFVVAHPGDRLAALVELFYERDFELAARLDDRGEVTATIDNPRVASVRLRLDAPVNASFLNRATRLRVDLLFDFPILAAELAERSARRTIRSWRLHIASDADLLQLKRLAYADRGLATDAQDIAFLEARARGA
ncbi:MAG: nucleotidyl transferase AbiEii/AbiGii toxin family protein [Acidobacteriota bacterium]